MTDAPGNTLPQLPLLAAATAAAAGLTYKFISRTNNSYLFHSSSKGISSVYSCKQTLSSQVALTRRLRNFSFTYPGKITEKTTSSKMLVVIVMKQISLLTWSSMILLFLIMSCLHKQKNKLRITSANNRSNNASKNLHTTEGRPFQRSGFKNVALGHMYLVYPEQ